jgi:hypothetical protein
MRQSLTSTISIEQFRLDWADYVPIAALCHRYGITKDQVIRLRVVLALPPRMDFSRRHKPPRGRDPTPKQIASACLRIQATWDEATRESRCVYKRKPVEISELSPSEPDDDSEDE